MVASYNEFVGAIACELFAVAHNVRPGLQRSFFIGSESHAVGRPTDQPVYR